MADQSDRPEPDVEEDAREGEVSDVGYPEAQPGGEAGNSDFPEEGPEHGGPALGDGETKAPSVSGEHDSPPGKATGNPRAAGP
jgi:hypothetical protein